MKPVDFKYSNKTLGPPKHWRYSDNVTGIVPMPIWTDGEQCVSCWKMNLWERIKALLFGKVWVAVLSGNTQPPVGISVAKEYLKEVDDEH